MKYWKYENFRFVYLQLVLNHKEFGKKFTISMLRNFCIFPMVYHIHQSDKRSVKNCANTYIKIQKSTETYFVYLKLIINCTEFAKSLNISKMRNFPTNPMVYHMNHSDKRFENQPQNTIRRDMQFWCPSRSSHAEKEEFTCRKWEVHHEHTRNLLLSNFTLYAKVHFEHVEITF
jgi:hypothetical protein